MNSQFYKVSWRLADQSDEPDNVFYYFNSQSSYSDFDLKATIRHSFSLTYDVVIQLTKVEEISKSEWESATGKTSEY